MKMINPTIPEKRSLNNEVSYWKRKKNNGSIECFSKEYFNSDFSRRNNDEIEEENKKKQLLEQIDKEFEEDKKKQQLLEQIMELLNDDSLIYQQLKYGTKKINLQGEELEKQQLLEKHGNDKNEVKQISELHYELSRK